jgi:hypothetical protein
MNKDTQITLGLIAVTAVGYYLWKKSQVTPVVASTSVPPVLKDPLPSEPTQPVETMPAPISNFAYANMAASPSGGFFESQKIKLNY